MLTMWHLKTPNLQKRSLVVTITSLIFHTFDFEIAIDFKNIINIVKHIFTTLINYYKVQRWAPVAKLPIIQCLTSYHRSRTAIN